MKQTQKPLSTCSMKHTQKPLTTCSMKHKKNIIYM